jgi:uncharacterized protein
MAVRLEFDWDQVKARSNFEKHKVSFEDAQSIFLDPLALSTLDEDATEERWITVGVSSSAKVLLVVHTHMQITPNRIYIRIISARKPNKREKRHYEQNPS